jgi:hypothetical protein
VIDCDLLRIIPHQLHTLDTVTTRFTAVLQSRWGARLYTTHGAITVLPWLLGSQLLLTCQVHIKRVEMVTISGAMYAERSSSSSVISVCLDVIIETGIASLSLISTTRTYLPGFRHVCTSVTMACDLVPCFYPRYVIKALDVSLGSKVSAVCT